MRVLFLTCHLPFPPISGGRLREYELLSRLDDEVHVDVCAVTKTYDDDRRAAKGARAFCASTSVFRAAGRSARSDDDVAAQVASHSSQEATSYVRDALARGTFDVLHVEGFYLIQHVPPATGTPVLLVEQNVEYELWRQRVETAESDAERRSFFLQYRLTREAELRAWRRSAACAAVTDSDRTTIRRVAPELNVRLIPDGADHLAQPEDAVDPEPRTIVLVGNFAYEPNVDAARWLCGEILPAIARRVPDVRLLLVGNDPPPELRALAGRSIGVTGRVPHVEPYLDRAAVVLCPLRIGGGVKVKVLEALRRGKPIVTTSLGIQGLGEEAPTAVHVADDADLFAAAVADLLERPRERRALGRAAKAFARRLPTWDEAADLLLDCYRDLTAVIEPEPAVSS